GRAARVGRAAEMVDACRAHGEGPPLDAIDHLALRTAVERELHQGRLARLARGAEEEQRLAVGRFLGVPTTAVRDALFRTSRHGGAPDVVGVASPIGAEIDPATVAGPARQDLVPGILREAMERCPIGSDDPDVPLP